MVFQVIRVPKMLRSILCALFAVGSSAQYLSWQKVQDVHGLSIEEARELGLNSRDLQDLGITNVTERISLLREIRGTPSTPKIHQDFTFVARHVNSTRQWGKCLNFIVRYRYEDGMEPNATGKGYIDYREIHEMALGYAKPTELLPFNVQWEAVNLAFVQDIAQRYSQLRGIHSVIQVMSENNTYIYEPGNHGSSVKWTSGSDVTDFEDLTDTWTHAFDYDCTRTNGTSTD